MKIYINIECFFENEGRKVFVICGDRYGKKEKSMGSMEVQNLELGSDPVLWIYIFFKKSTETVEITIKKM